MQLKSTEAIRSIIVTLLATTKYNVISYNKQGHNTDINNNNNNNNSYKNKNRNNNIHNNN